MTSVSFKGAVGLRNPPIFKKGVCAVKINDTCSSSAWKLRGAAGGGRARAQIDLRGWILRVATVVAGAVLLGGGGAEGSSEKGAEVVEEGEVRVGMLVYGEGQTGRCFSSGFLATAARRGGMRARPSFDFVALNDEDIFNYPFLILSGTGSFELPAGQEQALKSYLSRGGFLLASAGCSNEMWASGFEAVMRRIYPDQPMTRLDLSHPLFHMLFDIERLPTRKPNQPAQIWGLEIGGRLAVVYSPTGLNDTENAGGGCCCCGGNEIRNARQINANILAYALTH